jgi:fibronectin type 3 domain-containing protein
MISNLVLGLIVLSGCGSSTGNSKIDLTPPQVPADLSINQIGNGSVTLSWSTVFDSDLKGYDVYWQGGAQVDTLKANRRFTSGATITISDLDYETTYSFAVTSIDKSGNESALSPSRSGTPYNTTPPLPPANLDLVAENIDFPKITLYWTENTEPDIARYDIYRSLSASSLGDSTSLIASTAQNNFIDTGVGVSKEYYYLVKAIDRGGRASPPSSIVGDAVLQKVALISPVNFAYVSLNPTLTWEAVAGAKKYNIVITTTRIGGEIWNVEVDASETSVVYSGKIKLISGNTYYWKVGAISRSEINSVSGIGSFVSRGQ